MERSNPWNTGNSSSPVSSGDTSRQFEPSDFPSPSDQEAPPDPSTQESELDVSIRYSCPCCTAELDVTGIAPLTTTVCPSCRQEFRVLETIAGFTLSRSMGNGPSGSIFAANAPGSGEAVALKVFWPGLAAHSDYVHRVASAASALSTFSHPNIVRILSTNVEGGLLTVATEFVGNGATLGETMAHRGRLTEVETLTLAQQLVEALQAASSRGVLHGNLKPSNILFTAQGIAKLSDFGHDLRVGDTPLAPADTAQMPYYISPEKFSLSALDLRSDIYSLGAILFHALAGRPPFPGNKAELVAQKHLELRAPTVQAFTADISAATASVVARMLEKSPARRHQNYQELLDHLRFAHTELKGRHSAAPQTPAAKSGSLPANAKNWLPLAAAAPALLILGLGGWFIYSRSNNAVPKREAISAQQPASQPLAVAVSEEPRTIEPSAVVTVPHPPPTAPTRSGADDEKLASLIGRAKRARSRTDTYFVVQDLAGFTGPLAEKAHEARDEFLKARAEAQKDLVEISTVDAYRLVNRATGMCLTAGNHEGTDSDTLPVGVKPGSRADLAQCWRFQRFAYGEIAPLCARDGEGLTVESEAGAVSKLHLGTFVEANHSQSFKLKKIDNRYFTFASEANGKLLGIDLTSPQTPALVVSEDRQAPDQQWEFQPVPDAPKWAPQSDRMEIEWLSVIAKSDDDYRIIEAGDLSAKFATILEAYGPGAFVTLRIPHVAAGTYNVRLGVRASDVRARFEVALGPEKGPMTNIGPEQDPYRAKQLAVEFDLGVWRNSQPQDLAIRFTVTGKNSASKAYMTCLDYLKLVPAN